MRSNLHSESPKLSTFAAEEIKAKIIEVQVYTKYIEIYLLAIRPCILMSELTAQMHHTALQWYTQHKLTI